MKQKCVTDERRKMNRDRDGGPKIFVLVFFFPFAVSRPESVPQNIWRLFSIEMCFSRR